MTQEPQKSNAVLIIIAIIGVVGTIVASTIGVIGNYNIEKLRQETELTRIALVSIATNGGATQMVLQTTVDAPTELPMSTYTPPPTYTPFPTLLPTETPIPTPTATLFVAPADGILFQDDFDSGASTLWQPSVAHGTWRVINGRYTLTGESEQIWSYSLVGDTNWKNYVVDLDYSTDVDIYARSAIIVRAGGINKLSLAFTYKDGQPRWMTWQDGEWQTIVESDSNNVNYNPGHMRVEVNGNTFIGSMSGFNDLLITDTSTTNGQIGLGVWCRGVDSCPTFDNIKVTYLP